MVYMCSADSAPSWAESRWQNFVDFEFYNSERSYPRDAVFMYHVYNSDLATIPQHIAQGHRVIIDHSNEHYVHHSKLDLLHLSQRAGQQVCWIISGVEPQRTNFNIVATPYWYWILDQENLRNGQMNQFRYQPRGDVDYLCTMSQIREERDALHAGLQEINRPGLLSYLERGHCLPGDDGGPAWQRRINPEWLQRSYYTIVPESYVQDYQYRTGIAITERNDEFICEKTLKPLAAQHPFIVFSTRNTLRHVRDLGFETFPEIFDESYDDLFTWRSRLAAVLEQVRCFDAGAVQHPRVLDKLRHNQDRFFDRNLTDHYFKTTVAEPVLKWIYETT
jgi:hypothetical protein